MADNIGVTINVRVNKYSYCMSAYISIYKDMGA